MDASNAAGPSNRAANLNENGKRPNDELSSQQGQPGVNDNPSNVKTEIVVKTINRTTRACMRCIGAENPPCKRCTHAGLECLFEKPSRQLGNAAGGTNSSVDEERFKALESQVGEIGRGMRELVNAFRGVISSPDTTGSAGSSGGPAAAASSAGFSSNIYLSGLSGMDDRSNPVSRGMGSTSSPFQQSFATDNTTAPSPYPLNHPLPMISHESPSTSSVSSHSLGHGSSQGQQQQPHLPPANPFALPSQPASVQHPMARGYSPSAFHSSSLHQDSSPEQHMTGSTSTRLTHPSSGIRQSPYPIPPPLPSSLTRRTSSITVSNTSLNALPPPPLSTSPSHTLSQHSRRLSLTSNVPHSQHNQQQQPSGATTPAGSEDGDGDLPAFFASAPLASMQSISGLRENALDKPVASSSLTSAERPVNANKEITNGGGAADEIGGERGKKRVKFEHGSQEEDGSGITADGGRSEGVDQVDGLMLLAEAGGKKKPQGWSLGGEKKDDDGLRLRKGTHMFPDCLSVGIVTEEEAQNFFNIFWSGSSRFLAVFSPTYDTYQSLRLRSPFSFSAICMVGSRVSDGGGPVSELQKRLWRHVKGISMETLFSTTTRVEAIQATILLAGWNDSGWLIGGHAVRMAFDLGAHKAFMKLVQTGMGKGKSEKELEAERGLVIQARVWFCLYLVEHQMSYGNGRPPIVREDETIMRCREFLNHPLSIETDSRLVSTVELMAIRAPLHLELSNLPEDQPIDSSTIGRLQQANLQLQKWYDEWDAIFDRRLKVDKDNFYRQSLMIQKSYAELFHNCTALRGIRGPGDIRKMTPDQKDLALRALRNAQTCIAICLQGSYRDALKYSVHYTHICAAFAASLLIRIARLFPSELNLKQTAKDVEALTKVLADVPAGRYARSLRLILRKARKNHVIPPPSVATSPNRAGAQMSLPTVPGHPPIQTTTNNTVPFSPSAFINPGSYAASPSNTAGTSSPAAHNFNPLLFGTTPNMGGPSSMNPGPSNSSISNEESPLSNGEFGINENFDWNFAHEILDKVGIPLNEGDHMPLWLNGSDFGQNEMLASGGMENFFLPSEVDNILNNGDANYLGGFAPPPTADSTGAGDHTQLDPSQLGVAKNQGNAFDGEVWW